MKRNSYIVIFQRILLMLIVIFSLAPCTVKEALLNVADAGFPKTHNKPRLTSQTILCQVDTQNEQIVSVDIKTPVKVVVEPSAFAYKLRFYSSSFKHCDKYISPYHGVVIPKYILFKRLRIDVV